LQEQLFFKDVPALERALFPDADRKLSVCYMKGRNNYLCRKKLFDLTDQPVLTAWKRSSNTAPSPRGENHAVGRSRGTRGTARGQRPLAQARCPRRYLSRPEMQGMGALLHHEMRRRAAESDIIIVNHHLFFADLHQTGGRGAPDAGVLPECGAVIFDEAHELEEIAGNYFGISVSNLRMDELTRDVERLLQREKLYTPQMSGAIQSVRERSQLFFHCCPRVKAGLPSTLGASSSRKTEKNFSP